MKDFVPVECEKEAASFIENVKADIEIFRKLVDMKIIEENAEAESFCAWFSLERYAEFPHSLIELYEADDLIIKTWEGCSGNSERYYLHRMLCFYAVLRDSGFIDGER